MKLMRDLVGATLSERYRLVARIAGGGMGEVYRGHDLLLDRAVAVKLLRNAAGTAQDCQREYRLAHTMHPTCTAPAIGYGNSICDRVGAKMGYAQLVDQVKADFNTADYYQGAYLINQAVNELCPAQIWQLRQSAAGYTAS